MTPADAARSQAAVTRPASMPPTDGDLAISRGGLTARAAPNATAMERFSHQKNYLMAISSTRKWSVATVRWLADLPGAVHQLMGQAETVFLIANEHERATIDVDSRDLRMARQLQARYPLHRYARLAPLLRRLRALEPAAMIGS